MGRKRIGYDQAHLVALLGKGATVDEVAAAFGRSRTWAHARMQECKLQGAEARVRVRAADLAALPAEEPDAETPDEGDAEIPEGTTLAQIDKWLSRAEREAKIAADKGDVDNHVKWVRLAASLIEARRKATPIAKPDPNESPDMVEAAARVRKHWHDLANAMQRVANSPQLMASIDRLVRERNA